MWVVLASVTAPFLVAAFFASEAWLCAGHPLPRGLRAKWVCKPPAISYATDPPKAHINCRQFLIALLVWPLGVLAVVGLDVLAVAAKFGVHLTTEHRIVLLEGYHDSRSWLELLLESVPQAIFQTILYGLGSSRATRIYIDEHVFVLSIATSLLTILVRYACVLWEVLSTKGTTWAIVFGRIRTKCRPYLTTDIDNEDVDQLKGSPCKL